MLAGCLVAAGSLTLLYLNVPRQFTLIVMGLAALFVLVRKPSVILVLYPVLLLIAPAALRGVEFTFSGIRIDQLLLLLSFFVVVILLFIRRWPLPTNYLLVTYFTYIFMFVVSTLYSKFALSLPFSPLDFVQVAGLSRGMIILFVFMVLINSARRAGVVAFVVLCTGAFDILFGLAQYFNVPYVRLITLGFYNRKFELEDWLLFARITSVFDGQSNQAGMFSYVFGGLLIGIIICIGSRRPWLTLVAYALLALDMFFLMLTASRGALAGFVLAGIVVALSTGKRTIAGLVIGALIAVLIATVSVAPVLVTRVVDAVMALAGDETEEVGVSGRLAYWEEALDKYFWHSPVLGSGANYVESDSSYIVELASRGVIGLMIYIGLMLLVTRTAYVTWRRAESPLGRAYGLAVFFATIGVLVQGFTIPVLAGSRPAELYWLLVAAMWLFFPYQRRRRVRGAYVADANGNTDQAPAVPAQAAT